MSADINSWRVYGLVINDPVLVIDKNNKNKFARSVIVIPPKYKNDPSTYIPIIAYNKSAEKLVALAHRGCYVYASGKFLTNLRETTKGKQSINMVLKLNDVKVLLKPPVAVDEETFANTIETYDIETFLDYEGEKTDVE